MAMSERDLAKLPGVQAAVKSLGEDIKGRAQSAFASHNRPKGHRIGAKHSGVDSIVYLEGPAPGALEFGHFTARGDKWVPGIHVLGKAARG